MIQNKIEIITHIVNNTTMSCVVKVSQKMEAGFVLIVAL